MPTRSASFRLRAVSAWSFRIAAIGLLAALVHAAEPPDAPSVLHLTNGDFAAGQLVDSIGGDLAWKSPAFTRPLQFPPQVVATIQFPIPAELPQPDGEHCFELAAGDVVFGKLVSLQANDATLDIPGLGLLHVDRAILRRMYRWRGESEMLFHGPSGLNGWKATGAAGAWREESGNLVTDRAGAIIRRDLGLPPQARFEFELSWKNNADFEFSLGATDARSAQRAFRFEVWENHLVVQRETENEADLASLQVVKPGPGRVHLQAFLDQPKERLLVFTASGKPLADLKVVSAKPRSFGGVQLVNKSGDIRLERLTIGRWNGELPQSVESEKSRIHGTDGSIAYGNLQSYDAERRQFVVESNGVEQRVDADRVQDLFFSQDRTVPPRALRAACHNRQRISGDLVKVAHEKVWLRCPGIREELGVPVASLQSLMSLDPPAAAAVGPSAIPEGRLEIDGLVLRGGLVDASDSGEGCLVWKSVYSRDSSPLQQGLAARIIYRDPQPVVTPPDSQSVRAVRMIPQAGVNPEVKIGQTRRAAAATSQKKPILHLRSGDTIPCESVSIGEDGVNFTARTTDTRFIRNDQIKVLELVPNAAPVQIPRTKKERLLVLPRMQRDNPPTHLIRSVDGDYLRGRIVSMDDQQIQVEIRLEEKTLHRDRVARIIWLHADEIDGQPRPEAGSTALKGTRVQAQSQYRDHEGRNAADPAGEQRLRKILAAECNLEFKDMPLAAVLNSLKETHKIEIVVDAAAQKIVDGPHRVSLQSFGAALQSGLKLILEPVSLVGVADGARLRIATVAGAAQPHSAAALPGDGNRLTFMAERVDGTLLSGRSELLGACRVDLRQIDQLLIGPAIEQAAASLAFHQWRLKAALDPLAARDDAEGTGDGMEGQESALVGKAAPEIDLQLVDGSRFVLSSRKKKVVVLDFWASWCGPCLQVMPQVDRVAHEFADQGVELVAINLEETDERIKGALERLKLSMPVAMDVNGRVAERYGVTSIPQTVIIDRSGKVARLFVGGGPRFGDQLRAALEAVLADEATKGDATGKADGAGKDKDKGAGKADGADKDKDKGAGKDKETTRSDGANASDGTKNTSGGTNQADPANKSE